MLGAAQVLLKRFGATPVHVWCSAGHQSMQKKYEITPTQQDLKCGEHGLQTCPGQPRRKSKKTTFGNRAPGPHTLHRIYIEA